MTFRQSFIKQVQRRERHVEKLQLNNIHSTNTYQALIWSILSHVPGGGVEEC